MSGRNIDRSNSAADDDVSAPTMEAVCASTDTTAETLAVSRLDTAQAYAELRGIHEGPTLRDTRGIDDESTGEEKGKVDIETDLEERNRSLDITPEQWQPSTLPIPLTPRTAMCAVTTTFVRDPDLPQNSKRWASEEPDPQSNMTTASDPHSSPGCGGSSAEAPQPHSTATPLKSPEGIWKLALTQLRAAVTGRKLKAYGRAE